MANAELKVSTPHPVPVTIVSAEPTLAQKIDAKHTAKTDWDTDKKDWEYVAVPVENPLGEPQHTFSINNKEFLAGETYLVPPKIAETLKERIKTSDRAVRRRLMPNRDFESERQVDRFSKNVGGTRVDPNVG